MRKALKYGIVLILFHIILIPGKIIGQNSTVKGFIYDAETRQPLRMVNVWVDQASTGTLTDEDGFYIINRLPEGEITLKAFCIGYDTVNKKVFIKKNEIIIENLSLPRRYYELDDVNISGTKQMIARRKVSEITLIPAQIELTPAIGGMPDIFQHIQTIPGVVARGDIGGQLYIRGGTPIQTKVLLDEAVIYNPVHSIGLFSVVDNDYLRNVDLYTGGYDPEYGGCLSSVIDISTRMPNSVNWSGKIDLSTIASKLLLEGPVIRDSSQEDISLSVLLSLKSSHLERASDWFYSYLDQDLPFYFRDLYAKASLQIGKYSSFNISGYNFSDNVSETNSFKEYGWNSGGVSFNLLFTPPSAPVLIKTYFAVSSYAMTLKEPNSDNRFSEVGSLSAGIKFYHYFTSQTVKYGIDLTDLNTSYRYFTNMYNNYEQAQNSNELSGFIDYTGNFGRWTVEGGIRGVFYSSMMKFSPEPRLSLKFLIRENLAIKAAAGLYTQNLIGAISDKDIVNFFQGYLSAPVDMVNASNPDHDDYSLQKASHLVAGVEYNFKGILFFNIEAYYKNYTQLINFNKNKLFNEQDFPDAPSILTGTFIPETGYSKGIELTAKYETCDVMLEVNYSYALVKRRYQSPGGETIEYFPQYDRRHNMNVMGMYAFGRRSSWLATSRWNYGSGFPFTPSAGYYEGIVFDENGELNYLDQNGQFSILYGTYNSKRLPAYHRFDVAIKKTFTLSKQSIIETEFSIINLFNQENIFYIDRNTNEEVSLLPLLPSLRVSYSF